VGRFLLRRLAGLLFVLIGVTFIVHLLIHLVPGDPVDTIVGQSVSDEDRAALRRDLGLDRPLLVQYGAYLKRLARFDLGVSLITKKPIAEAVMERFPRTMLLAVAALVIAVTTGILAGGLTALAPRSLGDRAVMLLAVAGVSAPVFVTALALRWLLAERWPILPPAGYGALAFVILPALTLGSRSAAYLARITRTTLLETLSEDYIRTARAKGLSRVAALVRHAFPNAAGPLVAVILLDLAMYLNGSVITETIFAWPGLGRFALTAISQRDVPAIQAVVLVMAVTYLVAMAAADLLRAWLDPRLRVSS
jgi:ABC-type dipeptide/oligopeptide/nickel transport system permease component